MKWITLLSLLGLGLSRSLPAQAQDEMADTSASSAPKPSEAPAATSDEKPTATSDEKRDGKFVLGLRLGYALPMGAVDKVSSITLAAAPANSSTMTIRP